MLRYPNLDPVAVSFGPVQVHWYGLMYLFGFLGAWWLGSRRARRADSGWHPDHVTDLMFFGALGVVLGGRIGYVLFYDLAAFLQDPRTLYRIWQGGMSFHGGLIGVLVAMAWYARSSKRRFFEVTDFIAPLVPIGLATGRWGNFLNGELWGRPTELPWGMVYPHVDNVPRHPSQLYELGLEGVVLFAILWWFSARPRPTGTVSAMFLIGYGLFRFLVELARQPDAHMGFVLFGWMSMGQVLSAPMVLAGLVIGWWSRRTATVRAADAPRSRS